MAAEQCRKEFKAQAMSNILWAFAKLGETNELLFAALARAAEHRLWLCEFNSQEISNMAWAFASMNQWDVIELLYAAFARASQCH